MITFVQVNNPSRRKEIIDRKDFSVIYMLSDYELTLDKLKALASRSSARGWDVQIINDTEKDYRGAFQGFANLMYVDLRSDN